MLNLFDYLTEEDNRKIKNYVHTFAVEEECYVGNEKYLSYWAENNKKLFHLLGGKLVYKVPYEYIKSEDAIGKEIKNLIDKPEGDFDTFYDFINDKVGTNKWLQGFNIRQFWNNHIYTENKIFEELNLHNDDNAKILKIPAGCKPIRALQKILTYYGADKEKFDALERFRIALSMITNDKKVKGNLCFSIHPLDFMTMSDNASDWQSCMSWKHEGCYRLGTVEMMNSNNVICVYIENEKTPLEFGEDDHKDTWNNNRWRQLFYCTKEIIVSGKSYPYYNEQITKDALQILRTLAFENWHRTYEFGIERYRDMIHLGSLYRMENNRYWIRTKTQAKKHNIIFDSKAMYNDMFNDNNYQGYWCVRNKVKKNTIISYSGKAPCLCCMETVTTGNHNYDDFDEDAYNNRYDNADSLVCNDCMRGHLCDNCGRFFKTLYEAKTPGDSFMHHYCAGCWSAKIKKCPICHEPMNITELSSNWSIYDISNFNICNNCFNHFEDFDISKLFVRENPTYGGPWSCKDPERYKNSSDFDIYKKSNLEPVPLPTIKIKKT